jgi:hypothetical protein
VGAYPAEWHGWGHGSEGTLRYLDEFQIGTQLATPSVASPARSRRPPRAGTSHPSVAVATSGLALNASAELAAIIHRDHRHAVPVPSDTR